MSPRRETYRDYLATPLSPSATMHIEGNASRELKEVPLKWYNIFRTLGKGGFGCEAGKRIVVKELSIQPTVDDPSKTEARLVCEIEVTAGALQRRCTWHVNKSRYVRWDGYVAPRVYGVFDGRVRHPSLSLQDYEC